MGLLAGGAIGYGFKAHKTSPPLSESPQRENPDFSFIHEDEVREYYALKSMKERYEKADELLGKFVLALIAGRFMDVGDKTRMNVENSAEGRANSMPTPRCESAGVDTQVKPVSAPVVSAPVPAKDLPPSDKKPAGSVSSSLTADSLTVGADGKIKFEPGQTETFNFSSKASYKTTMCKNDPEWFVTEGQKSYFAAEADPDMDSTELIGTLVSTSLQKSEIVLMHCLNSTYKNWRVKISMLVKGEGVRNARFVARMWNDKNGEAFPTKRMNLGNQGTFSWQRMELDFDIGRNPFAFGIEMLGQGKIFMKDVKVTRVQNLRPFD